MQKNQIANNIRLILSKAKPTVFITDLFKRVFYLNLKLVSTF